MSRKCVRGSLCRPSLTACFWDSDVYMYVYMYISRFQATVVVCKMLRCHSCCTGSYQRE